MKFRTQHLAGEKMKTPLILYPVHLFSHSQGNYTHTSTRGYAGTYFILLLAKIANSHKKTFIALLGIFMVSSLICALASSSKMLIVARALAGIGASGIQNGALTIITRSFPPKKQARMYHTILPHFGNDTNPAF
jgi:MFS family permease